MKKPFCMKKFIKIILSICSIAVFFGCSTPRLSNKPLPEAVVRASPPPQPVVKDELILQTIQSRYQPIDSTQTRIYLYVEGMKGSTPVSTEDFIKLFNEIPTIDAGLAASIFHFGEVEIKDLKLLLKENKINVSL